MDMVARTLALGGVLLIGAAVQVWRESRKDRWQAAGLCYSCGNALGDDWERVVLNRKNEQDKQVSYCRSCAQGRRIGRGLMGFATLALLTFILLVCFYWRR